MRRREFVTFLAAAAVARPSPSRAKESTRVQRIGVLANEPWAAVEGLHVGLDELGYHEGKDFLVVVADTGLGISAEDQAKLFQKFSRIRNDKTKYIPGTGLGLWITAELARGMGATLSVESIENVGSHFAIRMPMA